MINSSAVDIPSKSYARIRNPHLLRIVRVGMLALFTIITVMGLISLPAAIQDVRAATAADAGTLAYLANLGISVEVATAYNFVLMLLQALAFTVAGFVIFVYRSDDWV